MSEPALVLVAFCLGILVGVVGAALAMHRSTIPRMTKQELAQAFYQLQTEAAQAFYRRQAEAKEKRGPD